MKNIEIVDSYGPPVANEVINFTENLMRLKFPNSFIDIIKQGDGIYPKRNTFSFINPESRIVEHSFVGSFCCFNPSSSSNIARLYLTLQYFFPKMVIPFAHVGNGDYICFDYSISGFDDPDPPIVYYLHENEEGKNIADIAINFKEFISMLKSEEEIDALEASNKA